MATVSVLLARKGHEVFRVPPSATLDELSSALRAHGAGSVLVSAVADGPLDVADVAGIVSERDVVDAVATHGAAAASALTAAELATTELRFTSPDASIAELATEMTRRRIRHLPVADGDDVVGVVSIGDAVEWHLSELESTAEALVEYVTTGRG